MPAWRDIKPSAIAPHLSIVWSYRYERDKDQFVGRLSGERIAQMFGRNLHGLTMQEIYPRASYFDLFGRCKRVIGEPALYRGHGLVFNHLNRRGHGERIILPLAEDGVTGDGLFGATVYVPDPVVSSPDPAAETIEWFAL